MKRIKFHWRRWLLLFTALAVITILIAGCASAKEEKPTIKIADLQFQSLWIENAIAKFIIEKGYGYTVETPIVDTAIAMVSLPEGDVHIWMELWQQNSMDWYLEETTKGTIENAGMIYELGPQFWVIPQWVHEEYGINTVSDMKEHWELFKDPEDPTKGAFYNCTPGSMCGGINPVKLEAYGLADYYNVITPGTYGALDAAFVGAQKKHQPVFGYYWAPTALMGMYDWYVLEEPEYDAEIWDKVLAATEDESLRPLNKACAYEALPIDKGVWSGLQDMAPDVYAMVKKMMVGLEPLNKACAWSEENEIQDYTETAIWYLNNYEERWETWVTDDAYSKIKDALEGL